MSNTTENNKTETTIEVVVSEGYGPVDTFMGNPGNPIVLIKSYLKDGKPVVDVVYGGMAPAGSTDAEKVATLAELLSIAHEATANGLTPDAEWVEDPSTVHDMEDQSLAHALGELDDIMAALFALDEPVADGWE